MSKFLFRAQHRKSKSSLAMRRGAHKTKSSYTAGQKQNRKKAITLDGHQQVVHDEFMSQGGTSRAGFQLKWLASTTIAGAAGILGILVAVYTSIDTSKNTSILATLQSQSQKSFEIFRPTVHSEISRSAKGDRKISKGQSIAYTIHDAEIQERKGRDFITTKPYIRLVGKLATYRINARTKIPAFNPLHLYANLKPLNSRSNDNKIKHTAITADIISISPQIMRHAYKNLTLSQDEVYKLTASAGNTLLTPTLLRTSLTGSEAPTSYLDDEALPEDRPKPQETKIDEGKFLKNTTTITKNNRPPNLMDSIEERVAEVKAGETFTGILGQIGTTGKRRQEIIQAMKPVYPAHAIKIGQKIEFTLLPVEKNSEILEPVKISLYNKSKTRHFVTISLDEKGHYHASKKKLSSLFLRGRKVSRTGKAALYSSIYESALMLNLPKSEIMKLLRIHAFETDYKTRVRPNDSFEAFYAATKNERSGKKKHSGKDSISELLYTSISVGQEKRSYYRFRLPDGTIDYYDKDGKSAQKFLMLKPVRTARLTSGFGFRYHPVLKKRKMHKGIDWAGVPVGTPILAAGNGVVEVARPAGGYGNYVRIRHANGYKSAYAHMVRFAEGMKKGIKVRQGQVIGYLGSTGRSTGPHLHFEILVNNVQVNPMKINVPSGKNLSGKVLQAFNAERRRIDELRNKPPVKTRIASAE